MVRVLFALIWLGWLCVPVFLQQIIPLAFERIIGSLGDGLGQFRRPQALDVDPAGNLYVADTGNHRVQWFDADGNFQRYVGGIGSSNEGQRLFFNFGHVF